MTKTAYKWDDSYIAKVEAFMGLGYSVTAFAGEIGVTKQTVYEWSRIYEDFAEALNRGRAKRALYWERECISAAASGEGDSKLIMFQLKNAAPDEFSDKVVFAGDPEQPLKLTADVRDLARTVAFMLASADRARTISTVPLISDGADNGQGSASLSDTP